MSRHSLCQLPECDNGIIDEGIDDLRRCRNYGHMAVVNVGLSFHRPLHNRETIIRGWRVPISVAELVAVQ